MSTFSTEPLAISENNNIVFKPDYKPSQARAFTFISFLNVPLKTEENEMTRYVKEYCDVHGAHYLRQQIGDITYHTRTRVYRCSNIKEHFKKLFTSLGGGFALYMTENLTLNENQTIHLK